MNSDTDFQLLFARNPLPMWMFDRETLAFVQVNDAALQHYGYTRDEFLSLRVTDIRPAEDAGDVREAMRTPPQLFEDRVWRQLIRAA